MVVGVAAGDADVIVEDIGSVDQPVVPEFVSCSSRWLCSIKVYGASLS